MLWIWPQYFLSFFSHKWLSVLVDCFSVAWSLRCPVPVILSVTHRPYLWALISNSSTLEGKSHLKSLEVVIWLQILKLIISGSKYRRLHDHLTQSDFNYFQYVIFLYGTSGDLLHKQCELEHFRTVLCAYISYSQTELNSAWKAHKANERTVNHFWLPHHGQGTDTSPKCQAFISCLVF